jgi:hypothetical protein
LLARSRRQVRGGLGQCRAGSLKLTVLPSKSVATQRSGVQDTAVRPPPFLSTSRGPDHVVPFEVSARPAASMAMQKDAETQDTPVSPPPADSAREPAGHAAAFPAKMRPSTATPTQNDAETQETPVSPPDPASVRCGADQDVPCQVSTRPRASTRAGRGVAIAAPETLTATLSQSLLLTRRQVLAFDA